VTEIKETLIKAALPEKLSRRKSTQKRRTEHENAYKSVENAWSPFYGRSPGIAPESAIQIRPDSSVAEHPLGKGKVGGSIPLPGTIKTTQRGLLSEMEVALRLARLGASVWTPAFGHDHPFDLIAHWAGFLSRVQVKTARDIDEGSIGFGGASVVDRAGGKQFPALTADDCDVIIGYHPGSGNAYVVRPVGKTLYTLRRMPPKNGQLIGIMFEADYRLTTLDQIRPLAALASLTSASSRQP
jgi:hypothetical protein